MPLYASLTERLRNQYVPIEIIVSTAGSDRLLMRPRPGKWNVHDNIAHLARYQSIFADRVQQILNNEEVFFGRYVAEEDDVFGDLLPLDIPQLLTMIKADRRLIYEKVTGLSDKELARTGTHKKFGRMNMIEWTECFLLHEAHHIFTIFQLVHSAE